MPTGASPVGVWESPACDARTYARRLELRADQTFTAEDFVSPCPEGAQCVWSGIETRKGEWQKGAKLILLREDPTGAKLRATFPLELEWDGRLREGACEYKRTKN